MSGCWTGIVGMFGVQALGSNGKSPTGTRLRPTFDATVSLPSEAHGIFSAILRCFSLGCGGFCADGVDGVGEGGG